MKIKTGTMACLIAGWAGMSTAAAPPDLPKATEYDYVIASEGLGLGLENHLQGFGDIMAWSTKDSIHLARLERFCTLSIPGYCFVRRIPLPSIAIPHAPLIAPPPFGLYMLRERVTVAAALKLELVTAIPGGKIYHYALHLISAGDATWQAKADSATGHPTRVPTCVQIGYDAYDIFGNTIFISGMLAPIQVAVWNDPKLRNAADYSWPVSEAWSTCGMGNFGTPTGGIWQDDYDTPPKRVSSGMPTAVLLVDSGAALGADGWVAVKEVGAWKGYHLTPGDFYAFRVVREYGGLGIWRYPRKGLPEYTELRAGIASIGASRVGNLQVNMAHRRQGVDASGRSLAGSRGAARAAGILR